MGKKTYADLKKKLYDVPGAAEFMSRERVGLARRVLNSRKRLDMTFSELLIGLTARGSDISEEMLYGIEWADEGIELDYYREVIEYLEGQVMEDE